MFGRSSGIDPKYDDPRNHDGKYPPDWDARRKAVYERDNYTCQESVGDGVDLTPATAGQFSTHTT